MSRPSRASLQTVIAATPRALKRSIAVSMGQGLVVIVWMQRRLKSMCLS